MEVAPQVVDILTADRQPDQLLGDRGRLAGPAPAAFERRLDAAGYLDSNGNGTREDKEGKEISLRIYHPTTDAKYAKAGQFVADWWQQIGIGATIQGFESDTLTELLYTPEAGGVWSDSNYSNPAYDALYDQQKKAATFEARKPIVDEMQNLIYDEAPYHVLFYDAELHAYRTDKFEGWVLQPRDGGVSLFATGIETYLNLVPAGSTATASPPPAAPSGASAAPSATPTGSGSTTSSSTPLLLGVGAVVVLAAVGLVVMRRGRATATGEDE